MKHINIKILFLFIVYASFTFSPAQTITQNEFINMLKIKHPIFEKEKMTSQIEQEDRNSYVGAQDWRINSSLFYFHEEPVIAISGPEKTDAIAIDGGIEKVFWGTGSRLSASYSFNRAKIKINPLWGFPNAFYQNKIALTYKHPLLKNKNGFLDRLQYNLKQYDIDFSDIQSLENQENFLLNSTAKFLDWVYLSEQEKIILERIKLSEEELERTKRKRRANLVDQADVIRSEDAVRIWKQNLMLVQSQGKALRAELAVLTQNTEFYNLKPDFELYEVTKHISLEQATQQLIENSRLIKTLSVRLDQLEYVNKGHKETLKPDLWAVAEVNTKNLDEDLGGSFTMDKPDALIGLQFNLPLGNRTAKSNITKTDLQISQLKKQIDEITITLTSVLSNLYTQIIELENVFKLNQEQINSAKIRTEEELKLYNQGRGDLTFVILSRDNEENAKLTYAQNAVTYHKLKLEYKALMDQLLK